MRLTYWILLITAALPCAAVEKITVYSQYDYAPFWQDGHGLTLDLAQVLTRYSQGRYQFDVKIVPRKRLDSLIDTPNWQGIIPWANPAWFGDQAQTRFVWSRSLMLDADLVISRNALKYTGPASLYGLRLGGILGHRYIEIESAIKDGKILRDDAPTQESNLKKIQAGRVDAIFIPYSSWSDLLLSAPQETRGLSASAQPRSIYQRHLLISPNNAALASYLQAAVVILNQDPIWLQKLQPFNYNEKTAHVHSAAP